MSAWAKVSASRTARFESGSMAVIATVLVEESVEVKMRSASLRPDSLLPNFLAAASGTSPVVVKIATWLSDWNAGVDWPELFDWPSTWVFVAL